MGNCYNTIKKTSQRRCSVNVENFGIVSKTNPKKSKESNGENKSSSNKIENEENFIESSNQNNHKPKFKDEKKKFQNQFDDDFFKTQNNNNHNKTKLEDNQKRSSINLSNINSIAHSAYSNEDRQLIIIPRPITINNNNNEMLIFSDCCNEVILIQKLFRKFISKKKLKALFLSKFQIHSKKNNVLMHEILPEKLFRIRFNDKIKEILNYLNINLILKGNKIFDIEEFFSTLFSEKSIKNLHLRNLRLKLNPIIRFISNEHNETYWGEWNMSFQKHGYGLKIVGKDIFYLGSFKNDEINGLGILIYNIKNKNEIINYDNKINNNNANNNSKNIDSIYDQFVQINSSDSELDKNRFFSYRLCNSNDSKSKREREIHSSNRMKNSSFEDSSFNIGEFNLDCSIYIGEFKNGFCQGKGELFLPNGEYYEGEFKKNKCNGIGEYFFKNNTVYKGEFINNEISGNGKYREEEFKRFRLNEKFLSKRK